MDTFEAAVYLGIVAIASAGVFFTIWLMIRNVRPKKAVSQKKQAALNAAPARALPGIEPPVRAKHDTGNKKKRAKRTNGDGELPPLKEYPDERLLEEKKPTLPEQDKIRNMDSPGIKSFVDVPAAQEATPVELKTETKQETVTQESEEVALPELPSLDTMTEGEEETDKGVSTEDLMSVFEVDETEDSTVSDLAANLFDVEAENIEKLGAEVSQILGEMRTR
jgi:hypothetical protein